MAAVTSAASAAAARIGAVLSDAQYFESSMVRVEDIRRQLDSRSLKDKLDAMKRVVALISLGKDASTFFPDVVKNVVAPSLDVKKLVYLYLVHYAEDKQDLALLAINSFQKDLSDHNQHIRALSLRVLSSIRVKVILQVVILAISKSAKDSSAYVRKAAAHAICKVCSLDSASKELLMEPLEDLISDRSTQVLGSAIAAFEEVCPNEFRLIHPHYRRLCRCLVDCDPWGQSTITQMLLRYARIHFANPYVAPVGAAASSPGDVDTDDAFGDALARQSSSRRHRDPDLTLLLESTAPLFFSLNDSVVMSVIALYYHTASAEEFCTLAVKPLMRLVAIPDDGGQAVALRLAIAVAARYPSALLPYMTEFYVSAGHSAPIRDLRMQVLTTVCEVANQSGGLGSKPQARRALLSELKEYLYRSDKVLAAAAARAIGCLATAHPPSTSAIVKLLSSVVATAKNPMVVTESIGVLRRLLQRQPTAQARALPLLISMLLTTDDAERGCVREPEARASIVWLIGEFYDKVQGVAIEALRLLARSFVQEESQVKLQILNLAAKVVAWQESGREAELPTTLIPNAVVVPAKIRLKLLEYVTSCARYDRDYDVRDKARMLHALFLTESHSSMYQSACTALLSRKPVRGGPEEMPSPTSLLERRLPEDVAVGSLAHVLGGRRLAGFRQLEPWAVANSDPSLRDEAAGDSLGSGIMREYTGISSADFRGSEDIVSRISSSVWQPPASTLPPSVQRDSAGNIVGFGNAEGRSDLGSSAGVFVHTTPVTRTGASALDPDSFYDSPGPVNEDSGSSEYDSTSSESGNEWGEADKGPQRNRMAPAANGAHSALPTVSRVGGATLAVGAPVAQPSYDLDELLRNVAIGGGDSSGTTSSVAGTSPDTVVREWRRAVESWNAGGVQIDVCFVRSASAKGPDVTPVCMRLTNRVESQLSDIAFVSQCGDSFVAEQQVSTLAPGAECELRAFARFRGKMTVLRFGIRINGKDCGTAELRPMVGEVLRPYPGLTFGDFLSAEKSLQGMFGSEVTLNLRSPALGNWTQLTSDIRQQVSAIAFVAHVDTAFGGEHDERCSVLFAGYLPSGEAMTSGKKQLLVRITIQDGETPVVCGCRIWVGCDDVLFAANLMQHFKSALLQSLA